MSLATLLVPACYLEALNLCLCHLPLAVGPHSWCSPSPIEMSNNELLPTSLVHVMYFHHIVLPLMLVVILLVWKSCFLSMVRRRLPNLTPPTVLHMDLAWNWYVSTLNFKPNRRHSQQKLWSFVFISVSLFCWTTLYWRGNSHPWWWTIWLPQTCPVCV